MCAGRQPGQRLQRHCHAAPASGPQLSASLQTHGCTSTKGEHKVEKGKRLRVATTMPAEPPSAGAAGVQGQQHTARGPHPAAHLSFMSVPGCVASECCIPPCVKQQGAAAGALHACRFGRQGCPGSAAEAPQPPQAMLSYDGFLRKYRSPTAAPCTAQLEEHLQFAHFAAQAALACC